MTGLRVLTMVTLALVALGIRPVEAHHHQDRWTIEDLLEVTGRPFAIGQKGFGDNQGSDPTRPIENTVASIRKAFEAGVGVVEIDVQITRDREVAVFHDDFLSDFTCVNKLTFAELRRRLPFVPRLEEVLDETLKFNRPPGPLGGLIIIELKAAAPLCDPRDTQDPVTVAEVSRVVRQRKMANQVMFTSFSPALLYLASEHAPEITRDLSISGLQFLTAQQIEALLGYPVTLINKRLALGLQWAEIGPIYRLPGYASVDEVIATAGTVRARVIEADLFFLQSGCTAYVDAVHAFGLKALGFVATDPQEWFFMQALGLDGIYTDDVPFGVAHQAPLP